MYWKTEGLGWKINPHDLMNADQLIKLQLFWIKNLQLTLFLLVGAPPEIWVHPQIEQLWDEQSGCTPRKLGAPLRGSCHPNKKKKKKNNNNNNNHDKP